MLCELPSRFAVPFRSVAPVARTPPLPWLGHCPDALRDARSFEQMRPPNWAHAATVPWRDRVAIDGLPDFTIEGVESPALRGWSGLLNPNVDLLLKGHIQILARRDAIGKIVAS